MRPTTPVRKPSLLTTALVIIAAVVLARVLLGRMLPVVALVDGVVFAVLIVAGGIMLHRHGRYPRRDAV
jgi:hypothetical protein